MSRNLKAEAGARYRTTSTSPGPAFMDRLLGEKGIAKDSAAGRRQFAALTEKRRAEESGADYEALRHDWVLGSEQFRQELLGAAVERVGPNHCGAERHETGVQKAERIVREELGRLGWSEEELRGRAKGHPGKGVIARRVRQETTLSLKWIAERLAMGTWTYVSNLLNPKADLSSAQEVLPLYQ